MAKFPKVSIIIPLYKITPYFYRAVEECLKLDYPDFEVLIGVDTGTKVNFSDLRVRVLKTGLSRTGPAEKRDIGIVRAKGELIAFLDDDSYPAKDWLRQAVRALKKNKVSSVCGPGLTPPNDSFAQKITGAILSTYIGTGPYSYRFVQQSQRYVDDYPAYNLIVRRDMLLKVGGFNNKFYGGEDTALCLKLIKAGEKILYHSKIVVYHHRKSFPQGYLMQVGNVGLHRGYFVKKYPQTSLRPSYFMPALGVLFGMISILAIIIVAGLRVPLLILLSLIYSLGIIDSLRTQPLAISLCLPACVFLAHASYAYNFVKGFLFTKNLVR